jgi:hypothetical protein
MKRTQANNKDITIDAIKFAYSKLNRKGTREFKAWFVYYFSMEYSMINLLAEDQVRHCYIVIQDIAAKKGFRKDE